MGFQLEYESTNVSQWTFRIGACGGSFTTPQGIFTSPSYPENYPNNADCIYTISQPTGTVIQLDILSMDIEYADPDYYDYDYYYDNSYKDYHQYGGVTCWDYLEIRDGALEQSPHIDGYCGDETVLSLPIVIQTTRNNVWMR